MEDFKKVVIFIGYFMIAWALIEIFNVDGEEFFMLLMGCLAVIIPKTLWR